MSANVFLNRIKSKKQLSTCTHGERAILKIFYKKNSK